MERRRDGDRVGCADRGRAPDIPTHGAAAERPGPAPRQGRRLRRPRLHRLERRLRRAVARVSHAALPGHGGVPRQRSHYHLGRARRGRLRCCHRPADLWHRVHPLRGRNDRRDFPRRRYGRRRRHRRGCLRLERGDLRPDPAAEAVGVAGGVEGDRRRVLGDVQHGWRPRLVEHVIGGEAAHPDTAEPYRRRLRVRRRGGAAGAEACELQLRRSYGVERHVRRAHPPLHRADHIGRRHRSGARRRSPRHMRQRRYRPLGRRHRRDVAPGARRARPPGWLRPVRRSRGARCGGLIARPRAGSSVVGGGALACSASCVTRRARIDLAWGSETTGLS
mmetsp:Transcript_63347/g.182278  ORF Transcript_63347/g.182278 Transcript_63347/m.182278 type:complete len:334 (-) Transcript_63347:40-1041(-)